MGRIGFLDEQHFSSSQPVSQTSVAGRPADAAVKSVLVCTAVNSVEQQAAITLIQIGAVVSQHSLDTGPDAGAWVQHVGPDSVDVSLGCQGEESGQRHISIADVGQEGAEHHACFQACGLRLSEDVHSVRNRRRPGFPDLGPRLVGRSDGHTQANVVAGQDVAGRRIAMVRSSSQSVMFDPPLETWPEAGVYQLWLRTGVPLSLVDPARASRRRHCM